MTQPFSPMMTLSVASNLCISEQIQAEILVKLGFIPPFFAPALAYPQVLNHLWQQTQSAYLDNPLPALFKEKLSAYLSRFCSIPYCMICHSCSLYALGVQAREVLLLLESSPVTAKELEDQLTILAAQPDDLEDLSTIAPEVEASLLACAIFVALESEQTEVCRAQLQRVLGTINYYHLVTFIAYVKTCHTWMEAHPEVAYQEDRRVQDCFNLLIEEEPSLAEFFMNYRERVRRDRQTWAEQQAELAERKRNQEFVQKVAGENLYLARAINSTTEGILITNPAHPDNPILYANPAFLRITGYELDEVIGQNCRFLQGPDTDRQVVAQIRQAIQEQREVTATLLNYRKDGHPFWNELKIAPVFSETGELLYFVGIQTDITERKQAEEALRQSESTLRSFFNSASMMMGVVELRADDILHISDNAASAQLFGLTPEGMQNRFDSELGVQPSSICQWIEYYRQAERQQSPVRFEYQHLAEQRSVWLAVTVSAIATEPEQPARFAYVVEDITERKQAEQSLAQQAQLLELASDAIIVRDHHDRITFWNQRAKDIYGWEEAEVSGRDSHRLLETQFPQPLEEIETKLLHNNHWEGELIHRRRDGKQMTVNSRWAVQRSLDGTPTFIMEINQDITEKKVLEAQFLRAQRMESIGTLAGGIAHDLNNVLTPILSSAQLLLMRTDPAEKKQQLLLETIQNSARRGATLIKQVLSFARGIEGRRTALQIRHLILEIRQIVQETFPKLIDLQADIAQDLWLVSGDATQLHQVLMNLCVNARDAMPDGGTLNLSATNLWIDEQYARLNLDAQVGAYIVITAKDTGTGIPQDAIDRIFEPFFTTKELGKGTGLGLSTVLAIVKSHGGFVEVTSAIGQGTQFKIYLPAVQSEESVHLEQADDLPLGQEALVLVVDDEAAVRESNQASLEAYGYRVITANDGIEAINVYAKHQQEINLVLMDLMMPSMDGATAIRILKRMNPQVKIVAVSGLVSGSELSATVNSDIQGFLAKPYTAKELVRCITEANQCTQSCNNLSITPL